MPTKRQILECLICYACYYFACVATGSPAPFLPAENERHGLPGSITGMMLGCLFLVRVLVSPAIGKIIKSFGIKKTLVLGTICNGVATAAFGCIQFIPAIQKESYAFAAFSIRIIQGVSTAAILTAGHLLLIVMLPDHSTFLLSIATSVAGMGIMSGPAIGSGFFAVGGFWAVFAAVGALLITTGVAAVFIIPSKEIAKSGNISKKKFPYLEILRMPRILLSYAVGSFTAAKFYGLDPILEPQLRHKYGLLEEQSALVFLLLSLTYAIVTPIAGKLISQTLCIDSLVVMGIGLLLNVVLFLFAGPVSTQIFCNRPDDLWLLLVCLCLMGISNCLLFIPAQDIIFTIERHKFAEDSNPVQIRAILTGLWHTFYPLGSFLGMTLAATAAEYLGWNMTMTMYSVASAVFLVLIILIKLIERGQCCKYPFRKQQNGCVDDMTEKAKLLPHNTESDID